MEYRANSPGYTKNRNREIKHGNVEMWEWENLHAKKRAWAATGSYEKEKH